MIELPRQVRAEVEKPFEEKLERARQLLNLWSHVNSYISCSFGKDSMIILFLALQVRKDFPVVYVDTGVDFPETRVFKEKIRKEWNLNLFEVKPKITFFDVMNRVKARGGRMDDGSKKSNICCYHLKEKPLLKFTRIQGFTHAITGITAMESRKRTWTACTKGMEYYAKKDKIWKVHPIMFWKPDEVFDFLEENRIPENPVYEKYGLDRTGCMCCTCYKGWREQLSRVNPKLYRIIMERYFNQKILLPGLEIGERKKSD